VETIGFIGLGVMGKPMALNLNKAGFPLVVHNRSRAAVETLVDKGASEAANPSEVAARCDVVITMLPDSPAVEQVVTGTDGVFAGARRGLLLVAMSTSSPGLARRLAREGESRGVLVQDAPVSAREGFFMWHFYFALTDGRLH
jgi:3-hydroxyisobutyrate dehydrogenase-like beta-hydroxyacid dehydrogenase